MSQFKGDYLRVQTPITSDGVSPVVENDRIKYREDHLPLTARKMLEQKNGRLPSGLRKKIEVVSNTVRPPIKTAPKPPVTVTAELDNEDFEDEESASEAGQGESQTTPQQDKPKGKGGRPKKNA